MEDDEKKELMVEPTKEENIGLNLSTGDENEKNADTPSAEETKSQNPEESSQPTEEETLNKSEDASTEDPQPQDTKEGEQEPQNSTTSSQDEDDQSTKNDIEQFKVLVDEGVQQVLSAFKGLQDSFDSKLKYDEWKDAVVDRQHSELEQFKKGLIDKITMQVVNDLISEADSYKKLITYYENAECSEDNFKKLKKILLGLPDSICDILEKLGVFNYSSEVGLPFDPRRQRVLMTTETGDKEKDKTVRALMRLGFEKMCDDQNDQTLKTKVIRPELVDVFVYKPELDVPQPTSETNQQETDNQE